MCLNIKFKLELHYKKPSSLLKIKKKSDDILIFI